MKVWVNVYYACYTNRTRFYFSQSYPTKVKALAGLAHKKHSMKDLYYDTIKIYL